MKKEKDKNRFYVYVHRRVDNNEVFYVGKGSGNRAEHISGRSKWWKGIYNKYGRIIEYVRTGLLEDEAYELEKLTIKFYKESGYRLCNMTEGGNGPLNIEKRKIQTYVYHDHDTGEIFESTQYAMQLKYEFTDCQASRITAGKAMRCHVTLHGKFPAKFSSYEFIDSVSGEELHLTLRQAEEIYGFTNLQLQGLVYGSTIQLGGRLSLKGKSFTRPVAKKYEFIFVETGETLVADYKEMFEKFGMHKQNFLKLVHGKLKTSCGYALVRGKET